MPEESQDRPETFGAAAFVLTATMLRELVIEGVIGQERAVALLENAIGTLRRLYQAVPGEGPNMVERDQFDFDLLISAAQEEEAERLLRAILDSLRRNA